MGRLAQFQDDSAEWFLGDALGSVRQLVDDAGNVVLSQAYDPYGQVLATSGTSGSGYGFIGEQQDAYTQFIYLRARWMDPASGRFLSADPWDGNTYQPGTLHKYLYVLNNAINRTDPSGKYPCDPGDCTCPKLPPPPGEILTPREYVERYKDLGNLIYPKTDAPIDNWQHGTLTLRDLQDFRFPERALLAMTAVAESSGSVEGGKAVMWIVRTRVKFNYGGFGTTYRTQILRYGQFSEYNWLHPGGGNAERPFMYAFDPKGRDTIGGNTQTYNWYKTAYRLAGIIMAASYERMPRELRRLDSFVGASLKYKPQYANYATEVGGNYFGSQMYEDDTFWDQYELSETEQGHGEVL